MYRLLIGLAAVVLLFAGCEKEETVRQLFFTEYAVGQTDVTAPAWFYPENGDVAYLCPDCPHRCMGDVPDCPEDVHGDACPFYKFSGKCSLVGDTLYYFLADEDSRELHSYDTEKHTRDMQILTLSHVGRSGFLWKGEYLYHYDRDIAAAKGIEHTPLERISLTTGEVTEAGENGIPWEIIDGIGYYSIADSDPHLTTGLWSQPLYAQGETPPAKTLLLQGVDLSIYSLLTEDAVYWIGGDSLRTDPNTVPENLYRYDRNSQRIGLLAENFGGSRLVCYGEYLYAVRRDGTRNVLMQIHTTDGDQKILYVPEEGDSLDMTTMEIVGNYLIVDLQQEETKEKLWFDLETGESRRRTFPDGKE